MNRTSAHRTALTGALLAGALAIAGCSGDTSHDGMSGTSDSSSSASAGSDAATDANAADESFASGMRVHHEQAVEMAGLAPDRAADPRVTDLAARIEAAQGPEIRTLSGWMEDWGVEAGSGTDHGSMGHGGMGGMMSAEDMTALAAASGAEFDRMFLEMMVEHHRGAIAMAETELADGENADARAMAESIQDTQAAEIAEMEQLLAELGG
ncbi:DUF305 domain-containing protein [Blastococcus atacamensis]|uniref:DUF305 domain-containing protein n=1 Tax=Blastococcus atacamensis TaxID=2070508 RepID=UPI000CEBD246|nr:DUF305 domain-containing protein [Blastococcus atacamensis]